MNLDQATQDLLLQMLLHELPLIVGALLLAYALVYGWRRKIYGATQARASDEGTGGIWLGHSVWSGVAFPALALLLIWLADMVYRQQQKPVLLVAAIVAFLALTVIRFVARVLKANFPKSNTVHLLERVFSWLIWLVVIVWGLDIADDARLLLDQTKFTIGKTTFTLGSVLEAAFYTIIVILVALWISAELDKRVYQKRIHDLSMRKIASNGTRTILVVLSTLVALSAVGIDLTAFSVIGGALGLGLGFGLQKLAANYVSGFVILLERSVRIGDHVKIDGFEGFVADIKTRYTLLRTLNGREAIIPNEKLISERVENLSLDSNEVLQNTNVSVAYNSDLPKVEELMKKAAQSHPRVLPAPEPSVQLINFGADGLDLQLNYWINDAHMGMNNVRSDINKAILYAFNEHQVEIPYPQRVMHQAPTAAPAPLSAAPVMGQDYHDRDLQMAKQSAQSPSVPVLPDKQAASSGDVADS